MKDILQEKREKKFISRLIIFGVLIFWLGVIYLAGSYSVKKYNKKLKVIFSSRPYFVVSDSNFARVKVYTSGNVVQSNTYFQISKKLNFVDLFGKFVFPVNSSYVSVNVTTGKVYVFCPLGYIFLIQQKFAAFVSDSCQISGEKFKVYKMPNLLGGLEFLSNSTGEINFATEELVSRFYNFYPDYKGSFFYTLRPRGRKLMNFISK